MDCKPLRKDIDISKPRYDQETYIGRAKYFFETTTPLNVFVHSSALRNAKEIVEKYRKKENLCITEDQLWEAKNLYDSAYHPDTGELMFIMGRMSFQVPGNIVLNGGMMAFKSVKANIFWQWANQSFNAVVNYTNRSGTDLITNEELMMCYLSATTAAVSTVLALKAITKNMPPLIGRCIPFVACAVANGVNLPLMRKKELVQGTPVFDKDGKKYGQSTRAAAEGIAQVVASRVIMAMPSMLTTPIIMNRLERNGTLCRNPALELPLTLIISGFMLIFATPLACAIFKQKAAIPYDRLEDELKQKMKKQGLKPPAILYYNKGL